MTVWSKLFYCLRSRHIILKICLGILLVVITTTTFLALSTKPAQAAPKTISFSARLKNSSGGVVPDGLYNVGFKLYNLSDGGTAIWSENYFDENGPAAGQDFRVRVINGHLSVKLGSRTAFDTHVDWEDDLWLTINIGGTEQIADPSAISWDGEMSPRIQLTAVPYAMNSGAVGGKTASDLIHNSTDLQNANFNISGTGTAANLQATQSVTTPSIDRADAGTLTIGQANATEIHLAQDVTIATGKTLTLAGGSTAERPEEPTDGMLYFDTTTGQLLTYSNGKWNSGGNSSAKVIAAGDSSQSAKDGADFVADSETVVGQSVIDGDQVQINAAIDELGSNGGVIHLTAGTYYLDGSILLPDNVTLSGAGSATIITVNSSVGSSFPLVKNSSNARGLTIRDIAFDGNKSGAGSNISGIELTSAGTSTAADRVVISGNTFSNFGSYAIDISGLSDGQIINNSFSNNASSINLLSTSRYRVSQNSIAGSDSDAIVIGGNSSDNTIAQNTISGTINGSKDININGSTVNGTHLSSNRLSGSSGELINDGGTDTVLAGQQDNNGDYTIAPSGSGSINLAGNAQISGTLNAESIQGGSLDSTQLGLLAIGGSNATNITIGNSASSTTVQGELRTDTIDTNGEAVLSIGGSNATNIVLGQDTSLAIDKTMDINGDTTIKSGSTDTDSTFKVQNTDSSTLFAVDAANNSVNIGSIDSDSTLLVVDTKTSAGDPAGTNGAMYYNADAGKFRCYEDGSWSDCITPLPISKVVETAVSNTTDQAIDADSLKFNLEPNTKYYYKFMLLHESALETTGIGFGVATPASPVMSNWCVNTTASLGATANHWGSYCGVGDASATTSGEVGIGTNFTSTMEGYIQTGEAAGDLTLRFKSESNNSTTIKPGSFGILQIVQ